MSGRRRRGAPERAKGSGGGGGGGGAGEPDAVVHRDHGWVVQAVGAGEDQRRAEDDRGGVAARQGGARAEDAALLEAELRGDGDAAAHGVDGDEQASRRARLVGLEERRDELPQGGPGGFEHSAVHAERGLLLSHLLRLEAEVGDDIGDILSPTKHYDECVAVLLS